MKHRLTWIGQECGSNENLVKSPLKVFISFENDQSTRLMLEKYDIVSLQEKLNHLQDIKLSVVYKGALLLLEQRSA